MIICTAEIPIGLIAIALCAVQTQNKDTGSLPKRLQSMDCMERQDNWWIKQTEERRAAESNSEMIMIRKMSRDHSLLAA